MLRVIQFVKDFNGIKGSRLRLADFFTIQEVEVFVEKFTTDNRTRPIATVGYRGEGVFGTQDEIYDNVRPTGFR